MLLATLILLPALAALVILAAPAALSRTIALGAAFLELALALLLLGVGFGGTAAPFAPEWLQVEALGLGVKLGISPVSYWLVLLTAALMPLVFLGNAAGSVSSPKGYHFWLTLLVMPMVGTFLARDAILFYVFFELTLVPMFFLIGIWGGADREYAAKKFFLYTFVGGVFTLAALLFVGINAGSFELATMVAWAQANVTDPTAKVLLFVALVAGFAVKVPLFPVHTWLPLAHTVAPTAGSVILAGVLLKLGTYGLLVVAIPMGLLSDTGVMPVVATSVIPFVATLAIVGVIYGALVAWVQEDVKKLVAYSSVSHLGFCVLGLVALNDHGMQGSVFYMINHGISTGALFLLIGMIYDRFHTRMFADYSGLGRAMPVFSFFLVLFTMSSIGLPGTNGFVSEFLTILGAFTSPYLGPIYGIVAAIGVVLGAIYMLHMVAKLVFGPLKLPETDHGHSGDAEPAQPRRSLDLNPREVAVLTPLAVLVIVLGVVPTPLLESIRPDVESARTPVGLQAAPEMLTAEPGSSTGEVVMGCRTPFAELGP